MATKPGLQEWTPAPAPAPASYPLPTTVVAAGASAASRPQPEPPEQPQPQQPLLQPLSSFPLTAGELHRAGSSGLLDEDACCRPPEDLQPHALREAQLRALLPSPPPPPQQHQQLQPQQQQLQPISRQHFLGPLARGCDPATALAAEAHLGSASTPGTAFSTSGDAAASALAAAGAAAGDASDGPVMTLLRAALAHRKAQRHQHQHQHQPQPQRQWQGAALAASVKAPDTAEAAAAASLAGAAARASHAYGDNVASAGGAFVGAFAEVRAAACACNQLVGACIQSPRLVQPGR